MQNHLSCVIVFLILCISAHAQQTYTLKLANCDQKDNTFFLEQSVNIITKHDIIEKYLDQIVFKTSAEKIKVHYENLYGQQMDTVFIVKEAHTTTFNLCLDNFIDSQKETCIENAIKKKARWKLDMVTVGCNGRHKSKIIIFPEKNEFIAKYVFSEYVPEKKTYKRVVKFRILNQTQLTDVVRFEKKLRLHGKAVKTKYGDQIGGNYTYTYSIHSGNMKEEIKTSLTLQTIGKTYLLEKLGF